MNRQLFNDYYLRKAIITGVILVVCSCIISQVMMQLGGGLRDEPLDLSDQVPEDFGGARLFSKMDSLLSFLQQVHSCLKNWCSILDYSVVESS